MLGRSCRTAARGARTVAITSSSRIAAAPPADGARLCFSTATASSSTTCSRVAVAGPSSSSYRSIQDTNVACRNGRSHLHYSAKASLPRMGSRRTASSPLDDGPDQFEDFDQDELFSVQSKGKAVSKPTVPSSNSRRAAASPVSDEVPWFLAEEVIKVDRPPPMSAQKQPAPSDAAKQPDRDLSHLPASLQLLHNHLMLGSSSNLLYKSTYLLGDFEDDMASRETIEFIPSHKAAEDDGSPTWCDWTVVVTVRENTGGNVNERIAREVGNVLSRVGAPSWESRHQSGQAAQLDDLLGPGGHASGLRDPFGPRSTAKIDLRSVKEQEAEAQQLDSESADSSLDEDPLPDWAVQKAAVAAKLSSSTLGTTAWRPLKILSRETQNGLRALHASDPKKWHAGSLAQEFKVSPEAMRRILKADPRRWGGDGLEKGLRSMEAPSQSSVVDDAAGRPERWAREDEEIAKLRGNVQRDRAAEVESTDLTGQLEQSDDFEEPLTRLDEDRSGTIDSTQGRSSSHPSRTSLDVRSLGKPSHPIRYEGLASAQSTPASRRRSARRSTRSSGGSGLRNNSEMGEDLEGEWVLVDAGWCVVHVMTPRARQRWDVEGKGNRRGEEA